MITTKMDLIDKLKQFSDEQLSEMYSGSFRTDALNSVAKEVSAMMNNELERKKKLTEKNNACAREIDRVLHEFYDIDTWCLKKECIYPVLQKFGYDCVSWVLAFNIQQRIHDGRISRENKEWGKKAPDRNDQFECIYMKAHSGLINIFVDLLQKKVKEVNNFIAELKAETLYNDNVDNPDHVLNQALAVENCDNLTQLFMNGRTDFIRNYLQSTVDMLRIIGAPYPDKGMKELLDRLNAIVPDYRGTVIKVTQNNGNTYSFFRIPFIEKNKVKRYLAQLVVAKKIGFSTEKLESPWDEEKVGFEYIGGNTIQRYSPNFPCDLEINLDTMQITYKLDFSKLRHL